MTINLPDTEHWDKFIFSNNKLSITFIDNIFSKKTLTEQFETAGRSNWSYSNNWFNSSLKTNSGIIWESIDQDQTLKNETTYIGNEDIRLLSSTVIPENKVEERTIINSSENSLSRETIISNHTS